MFRWEAALGKGGELWQWAVHRYFDIPLARLQLEVTGLRERYAAESDADLARRVYAGVAWRSTAMGLAIGVPGHPAIAFPVALVEAAVGFRMQVTAACKVALIYDRDFFLSCATGAQAVELMRPLLAGRVDATPWVMLGGLAGRQIAWEIFRWVPRKGLAKVVGAKSGQRVFKVVPIVGAVWGAAWNLFEVCTQGEKLIAHFEGRRAAVSAGEPGRAAETANPRQISPPLIAARGSMFEERQSGRVPTKRASTETST